VEKGRSPKCVDGVVGGTRSAGRVDVVWAETRKRSPGSRKRVVQRDEFEASAREAEKGGGTAPTFIGLAARGEGPPRSETSSPLSGALIGPDPSCGPLTLAGNRLTSFLARSSQTAAIFRSDPMT